MKFGVVEFLVLHSGKINLPMILSVWSIVLLLLLLILDMSQSLRRKKHWIHEKYLLLRALSLQLLGLVQYLILIIINERRLKLTLVKDLYEEIHNKQLLILVLRVVKCIFM